MKLQQQILVAIQILPAIWKNLDIRLPPGIKLSGSVINSNKGAVGNARAKTRFDCHETYIGKEFNKYRYEWKFYGCSTTPLTIGFKTDLFPGEKVITSGHVSRKTPA